MWGRFLFAVISGATESGRPAVLAIIVFFVLGAVVQQRVDIDAAWAAKERWVFDGAEAAMENGS